MVGSAEVVEKNHDHKRDPDDPREEDGHRPHHVEKRIVSSGEHSLSTSLSTEPAACRPSRGASSGALRLHRRWAAKLRTQASSASQVDAPPGDRVHTPPTAWDVQDLELPDPGR